MIEEAAKRFPGAPIKAVISTSDSWPHIGGVREYVARGIPVYVLDRTRPLLVERLVAAPRSSFPDRLATNPREPEFRTVSEKTVIGTGQNRLEIYPIRGETSERQMMVYFPQYKRLYGSDPFQRLDDGALRLRNIESNGLGHPISEIQFAISQREHSCKTEWNRNAIATDPERQEYAQSAATLTAALILAVIPKRFGAQACLDRNWSPE